MPPPALANWALTDWLDYIQKQHLRSIDLTLERIAQVWKNLHGTRSDLLIAVAGTNGKGSSVAMLSAVLQQTGNKIGSYTSPHIVRYNERICINGQPTTDAVLCRAFVAIEQARNRIPLTYFEFGTLCALLVFAEQQVDVSIMEVGMGGRLDAVNLLDNDLALITSIGIDHTQWLGNSRARIAREKAGIVKKNALAVCTDPNPPQCIADMAAQRGCTLLQNCRDYHLAATANSLTWHSQHPAIAPDWQRLTKLQSPFSGAQQHDNLGGVVATLALTQSQTGVTEKNLTDGLKQSQLVGRCQVVSGSPEIVLDVAHNHDSTLALAAFLASRNAQKTHGVLGVMAHKSITDIITAMDEVIDYWYLATLANCGYTAQSLKQQITKLGISAPASCYESPVDAYLSSVSVAKAEDRVVIFGSFYTVGAIITHLNRTGDWATTHCMPDTTARNE